MSQFSQIVLVGLGFDIYQANLFTIATGAIHGTFGFTATYICSRYKNVRAIVCIVLLALRLVQNIFPTPNESIYWLFSLMGSLLVRFGPNLGSKLFGFLIFYAYPCTVAIGLSMVSSNVAGFTKKSVATVMATLGYTTGNIIGPFLFLTSEKPRYPVRKLHSQLQSEFRWLELQTGYLGTSICFAIAIVLMVAYMLVIILENKRRDRVYGPSENLADEYTDENARENDLTDGKNSRFRYMVWVNRPEQYWLYLLWRMRGRSRATGRKGVWGQSGCCYYSGWFSMLLGEYLHYRLAAPLFQFNDLYFVWEICDTSLSLSPLWSWLRQDRFVPLQPTWDYWLILHGPYEC